MKLIEIKRFYASENCTLSKIYVNKVLQVVGLEPPLMLNSLKVFGKSAMPTGSYKLKWSPSVKFGCLMPFIVNVPKFMAIMFHAGNTVKDTRGCVVIGLKYDGETVLKSRAACELFFPLLDGMDDADVIVSEHIVMPL